MHFLRCVKCDKKANYCRVYSRLCGGYFYDCSFFSNDCVVDLGFYNNLCADLDVFLYNVCDILGGWTKGNKECSFFQDLEYFLDLFSVFSSVFIRLYLNLTIDCLDNFLCQVALIDKNKLVNLILKHADIFFSKFWNETNSKFVHEFLDLSDQVSKSVCFKNHKVKPKFGLDNGPQATLPVLLF